MSGGSSTSNSWTIVSPEETVTETLRPLAEGIEHHEESLTSETGSGENQPTGGAESAEGLSMEGHQVSEERTAELSEDTNTERDASVPTAITETPVPTSLEVSGNDALSQSEGLSQSSHDPDSFSDSYTHITHSSDAPPATLLSTETLGGVEFTQEEERLTQEGILHPPNGEGQLQEGEESDLSQRITDVGKQPDSTVDSEVGEQRTEKTGEEGEPEVRRRRSLLAALERIGRTEEEEEVDEEFQLPQQKEDSGFSLNKCILGALILLGLGTIFFSESDYGTRELRDTESPGKQEWLNPEVSPPPVDADNAELLDKLAKGNQQISILQAQLQAQTEELNVAKEEAAKGAKERLRWGEVEKENTREAVEAPVNPTTSPSSGQPEDSMKGTAGFTERQPRKPWNNQTEKKKDEKKDKDDIREKEGKERKRSEWKEGEKKEPKEGGESEWKIGKHEQGKFVKEKDKEGKQKWHSDETKQWKVEDQKKEKARRGDQGKSWKDREDKKEWKEKSDRKEWTEEKEWKKAKREKVDEGKRWRSEEDKRDWKVRKEHGDRHKGREEWKEEKEWKKGKDGYKENGKDKWEKKEWKEKGEKKEWKKDSKDYGKEGKWKGERKRWEENKNHGKENKRKDERKQWNENEWKSKSSNHDKEWKRKEWEKKGGQKEMNDWIKDETSSQKYKEHKFTSNRGHEGEHLWGDRKPVHTHRRPSLEQPEYWIHQRERFQHNPKSPQHCNSLETCAQAEGLHPVPFPEFELILQTYLAKAEEAGVDASIREELKNLATEFFKDGVFVHDQMSFQDFVEDLGDVLEDMVEGDDNEEGEDSAIEEEMEGFKKAVVRRFSVPGAGVKEKRSKGEWRKESGRGHG